MGISSSRSTSTPRRRFHFKTDSSIQSTPKRHTPRTTSPLRSEPTTPSQPNRIPPQRSRRTLRFSKLHPRQSPPKAPYSSESISPVSFHDTHYHAALSVSASSAQCHYHRSHHTHRSINTRIIPRRTLRSIPATSTIHPTSKSPPSRFHIYTISIQHRMHHPN